jgi:tetratricopeptide (TPR) repeat protein
MKPLVLLVIALLAVPTFGEVVYLNDGTTLEGDIRRTNEGWLVTDADGKTTLVTTSQVKSIQVKKIGPPTDAAEQGLASLRRAVANQSDVRSVLDRYRSFISQHPGTPAAKAAEQDMAQWQERLDKGLVKAGDQWTTREHFAELQAAAARSAGAARSLIAGGKLADALNALDRALAISPQNAALLYLKGVAMLRQSQLVPARSAYLGVEAVAPEHAPTHNNIAVILWRQRAQMPALAEYDKAMLAEPQNQTILDNVAEALNGLATEHRKNDLTKRVVEHFNLQDDALQKKMAQKGQYRWGSQWLDEKDFAKIQAEEKEITDKLASMQKDFDGVQADLLKINRDIMSDQQIAQSMAASTMQTDPTTGRTMQLPLPQRYFDLMRDIENLKGQRTLKQQQLTDLQKLATHEKSRLPLPKYTGIQKAFDVEGTPGEGSTATYVSSPTTMPAAPIATTPAAAPADPTPATPPPPKDTGGFDFAPATQSTSRVQ